MSTNTFYEDEEAPFPHVPLSPWAGRYGSSDSLFRFPHHHPDRNVHSGLAPMKPDLPLPQWAMELSDSVPPSDPPTESEADQLYISEREQVTNLVGLRSWQLGAIGGVLHCGIPSGHGAKTATPSHWEDWVLFSSRLAKVDDTRWPIAVKREWYDLRSDCSLALQNPVPGLLDHPNRWWTVDNPVIWNLLRPSLEIVNRIFVKLLFVRNPWMLTILFGKSDYWANSDPNIDFDASVKYKVTKISPGADVDHGTIFKEFIHRTATVKYSFMDETLEPASRILGLCRKFPVRDGYHNFITINVDLLRPLLERDATLAERCISMFQLINTLVHEMGHALFNPSDKFHNLEPFYGDEWVAELGFSLTKEVFGAIDSRMPTSFSVHGLSRGLATHCVLRDFPNTGIAFAYDVTPGCVEQRRLYASVDEYSSTDTIPTLWISAFLTEQFWTEIVQKYGSMAFRPPNLLSSLTKARYDHMNNQSARRNASFSNGIAELDQEYSTFLQNWQERKEQWRKHRPWYDAQYRYWQALPWSYLAPRDTVEKYRYHHACRHTTTSRTLSIGLLNWGYPYATRKTGYIGDGTFKLFYLVSLLAFASCPLTGDQAGSLSPKKKAPRPGVTYYPSSAAVSRGPQVIGPVTSSAESREKKDMSPPPYFSVQLEALEEFRVVLRELGMRWGAPKSWLTALVYAYTQIKAEREANPLVNSWTSFPFKTPKFSDRNWVKLLYDSKSPIGKPSLAYRYMSPGTVLCEVVNYISPPGSPSGAPVPLGGTPSLNWGHVNFNINPAVASLAPLRLLHAGEVGNHRHFTDAWVVYPDGRFGHDVYQISGLLASLGANQNDYGEIVKVGPMGPELISNDARADIIRNHFKNPLAPIGKLISLRHPEEIAECNGKDGKPPWVTVGPDAYDLTYFQFSDGQESDRLLGCAGGPIPDNAFQEQAVWPAFLARLGPYCCAFVESNEPDDVPPIQYYTPRTLRWHDNPGLGYFMAIGGVVYDMGRGSQILTRYMGHDATEAFSQFHNLDIMKDHDNKRIGYLVPEVELHAIDQRNHIVLHDWVYDISGLAMADPDICGDLQNYVGTDATAALSHYNIGSRALHKLLDEKSHCIVAGVAKTWYPSIPMGEIALHTGVGFGRSAWVTVSGHVYNVGDLVRYPNVYEYRVTAWAGTELGDPFLANWLVTNFDHLRIGRLIAGPAWLYPQPTPVHIQSQAQPCLIIKDK